jgi:hypothetical protein
MKLKKLLDHSLKCAYALLEHFRHMQCRQSFNAVGQYCCSRAVLILSSSTAVPVLLLSISFSGIFLQLSLTPNRNLHQQMLLPCTSVVAKPYQINTTLGIECFTKADNDLWLHRPG